MYQSVIMSVVRKLVDPSVPTEVAKNVWIGDMVVAKDFRFFVNKHIKRVVNCTPDVPCYFDWCDYVRIPVGDSSSKSQNEIMKKYIPIAVKFIMDNPPSDDNAVLIHCHVGVSRSCTIAAALLRACCADTIPQALSMVVSKRPVAFFNGSSVNFKKALYDNFGS